MSSSTRKKYVPSETSKARSKEMKYLLKGRPNEQKANFKRNLKIFEGSQLQKVQNQIDSFRKSKQAEIRDFSKSKQAESKKTTVRYLQHLHRLHDQGGVNSHKVLGKLFH